jgi:hypothetical protein
MTEVVVLRRGAIGSGIPPGSEVARVRLPVAVDALGHLGDALRIAYGPLVRFDTDGDWLVFWTGGEE